MTRRLLAMLACSLGLLLVACTNKQSEIDAAFGVGVPREDRAEDVVIILSQHGIVQGRLFAKEFIRNDAIKPPYIDLKKDLKLEVFGDSLRLTSLLTAKYARYYEESGNFRVRDSIVVRNPKGERLTTEELVWNQKLQKFYTDKPVQIRTGTQIIFGEGMEANQDFSWYQIKSITGTIQVNKADVPGD